MKRRWGRPKSRKNRDLPPHVIVRTSRKGVSRYYYRDGARLLPLGKDRELAKSRAIELITNGFSGPQRVIRHEMMTENEVVKAAVKLEKMVGIYFLIVGRKVVYVGQSKDIQHRIRTHITAGKRFDAYHYVQCHVDDLDRFESSYIALFKPRWNVHMPERKNRIRFTASGKAIMDLELEPAARPILEPKPHAFPRTLSNVLNPPKPSIPNSSTMSDS